MAQSPSHATDSELIAEILTSDGLQPSNDAYRLLLNRYWKVVVALLRSRVSSLPDAEDLAQETFVRAFRSLPRLKKPEHFLSWLLRISQNLATDHLRRRRSMTSLDGMEVEPLESAEQGAEQGVHARLETQEEMTTVLRALGQLPDRYRAVVALRYLKGYSNRQMAALLGEPEGTIRNRLFRALAKLRDLVDTHKSSRT